VSDSTVLATRHLVKRFPGVTALKGVSFDLQPGEVHALCGENGAGKSTLIKVLSGVHPAGSYEGQLLLDGQVAEFASVKDSQAAGVAVIYQELALVPEMSVGENLYLGNEPRRWGLVDWNAVRVGAREVLNRVGVDVEPDEQLVALGVGKQQLVEIAKALLKNSRVLILDEPTAALAEQEVRVLLNLIKDLRARGISCIYISHKLDEVMEVADRITVLRDGQSIITLSAPETHKREIIRHMVGREIADLFPRRASNPGNTILHVNSVTVAGDGGQPVLRDISFEVRSGEVLGIGGLMGAGRTELLMHLFGAWGKRVSGSVTLAGEHLDDTVPHASITRGISLVSEDRKRYGLILDQSIAFNLSLSSLEQVRRGGMIDQNMEIGRNQRTFDSLRVKANDLETRVGTLSGGNQQKIVIGKALMTDPKVIFLDEPTRGIDVGAKLEVYELINRLTDEGKAVVLVSSELPELMGMSDRILMLHEGKVGGEFNAKTATPEQLIAAAMGQVESPASPEQVTTAS
jgi:D-xylose transport system ATP-binding protein